MTFSLAGPPPSEGRPGPCKRDYLEFPNTFLLLCRIVNSKLSCLLLFLVLVCVPSFVPLEMYAQLLCDLALIITVASYLLHITARKFHLTIIIVDIDFESSTGHAEH